MHARTLGVWVAARIHTCSVDRGGSSDGESFIGCSCCVCRTMMLENVSPITCGEHQVTSDSDGRQPSSGWVIVIRPSSGRHQAASSSSGHHQAVIRSHPLSMSCGRMVSLVVGQATARKRHTSYVTRHTSQSILCLWHTIDRTYLQVT